MSVMKLAITELILFLLEHLTKPPVRSKKIRFSLWHNAAANIFFVRSDAQIYSQWLGESLTKKAGESVVPERDKPRLARDVTYESRIIECNIQ